MGFTFEVREPLPKDQAPFSAQQKSTRLLTVQTPGQRGASLVHDVRKHLKKLRAAMRPLRSAGPAKLPPA